MKTYIKRTLASAALAGITFSSIAWVYAMSDADFKKSILTQIQIEDNLTDEELQEIAGQLEDISKQDILSSLLDEMNQLENNDIKKNLLSQFEILKKQEDGQKFFSLLDGIYESLDSYYMEHQEKFEEDLDWEYNFEEEKKMILENLEEEKKYISDEKIKSEMSKLIIELTKQTDEDKFFEALNGLYEKVDVYYGVDFDEFGESWEIDFDQGDWEYDFKDLKQEILDSLKDERSLIQDKALKAKFETVINSLEKQENEEKFFKALDTFYSDEAFEKYYESQWIDLITGDEFLDWDFDFNTEKPLILEGILMEIDALANDEDRKAQLEKEYNELKNISNEDDFFESLNGLYENLDVFYGEWKVMEFNFQDEKWSILEWINQEISNIQNADIKKELQKKLEALKKITDEDSFFESLNAIYSTLDEHYQVEGIEYYGNFDDENWDFDFDDDMYYKNFGDYNNDDK